MDNLQQKLETAEKAEKELQNLQESAAAAPALRAEAAKEGRQHERESSRQVALDSAKQHLAAANLKQAEVKPTLDVAVKSCFELFKILREVGKERGAAIEQLLIVDGISYEFKLEAAKDKPNSDQKRDSYSLAVFHGEKAAGRLLAEMDPNFSYSSACDLNERIYKEVFNLCLNAAAPPTRAALPREYQRPTR